MDERTQNLIAECERQEESCLYMSTTIFEWLKSLRRWRFAFVVVPIVLGGLATWPLLTQKTELEWFTGVCALLAGLTPAVYKALELDVNLKALASTAHQFKILQDRFRQASRVTALGGFDDFKKEVDALMERIDTAREGSITAPERFFKKAQQKIKSGDYAFSVDMQQTAAPLA
ncbi:hypothetical protein PQQ96_24890 [Paraburkholderia sediminicola]|uniref:hypothetical protein n=1 Tax=Paraburkholderia sediminicola TaxID=458836 RepID=UPI0038BCC2BB